MSGSYENPMASLTRPSPHFGCSPGSSKFTIATTFKSLSCYIISNSLILRLVSLALAIRTSEIRLLWRPLIHGFLARVQSSTLQLVPKQNVQTNSPLREKFAFKMLEAVLLRSRRELLMWLLTFFGPLALECLTRGGFYIKSVDLMDLMRSLNSSGKALSLIGSVMNYVSSA